MNFFIKWVGVDCVRGTGLGFLLLGPHTLKSVTWLKPTQPLTKQAKPSAPGRQVCSSWEVSEGWAVPSGARGPLRPVCTGLIHRALGALGVAFILVIVTKPTGNVELI